MESKSQQAPEFRILSATADDCRRFSRSVNAGWTTKYLFTGSIPMRPIDVQEAWKRERANGDLLWGIYGSAVWDSRKGLFISGLVGTMGLHSHRDIYRSWELRIIIFEPSFVGKGVGSTAVRFLIDYAFSRLNAHRLWLGVNADNERAVRCYKSCGFKEEGRLRDEIFCFGKYHDAIRMSILEDEWHTPPASSAPGESE